jgi:hypothetical protein
MGNKKKWKQIFLDRKQGNFSTGGVMRNKKNWK